MCTERVKDVDVENSFPGEGIGVTDSTESVGGKGSGVDEEIENRIFDRQSVACVCSSNSSGVSQSCCK